MPRLSHHVGKKANITQEFVYMNVHTKKNWACKASAVQFQTLEYKMGTNCKRPSKVLENKSHQQKLKKPGLLGMRNTKRQRNPWALFIARFQWALPLMYCSV